MASLTSAFATLHLADLFREPRMVIPTQSDWLKVKRWLTGEWPKPFPPINTDPYQIEWESGLAFDSEYVVDSGYLLRFSVATPSGHVSVIEHKDWLSYLYRTGGYDLKRQFEPHTDPTNPFKVVIQNAIGARDLEYLAKDILPKGVHLRVDDLLLAHALQWSEFPHTLEFIASIYSPYNKTKHLAKTNPTLYAAGDAVDTLASFASVHGELAKDPRSLHIYESRSLPLIPILRRAHSIGIKVDKERAQQALAQLETVCHQESLKAQAWCGYPINLGSPAQVVRELNWQGVHAKSVEAEDVYSLLIKHSDNELLQARLRWSQAEGFRKFVGAIHGLDRVYPDFLPTQATGRISVSNPPIVGFPDDAKAEKRGLPKLRGIFLPDPDTWWLALDYSSMHARFMAAASNDPVDLEAYATGADIHALTAQMIFNKPTVDKRERHLAKTVRFALLNGLDHKAVREAKEVVEQGLDMDELEQVAKRFLATKPAWVQFKRQFVAEATRVGEARSLYGRKRRLMRRGDRAIEENAKDAISGFLQGTECDIVFETLIYICHEYPECRLVYPSHDGFKLAFPLTTSPWVVYEHIKGFVEREHNFFGVHMALPADWGIIS